MARKSGFIPEQPGFSGFDLVVRPRAAGRVRARMGAHGVPRPRRGGGAPDKASGSASGSAPGAGGAAAGSVCQADLFTLPLPPLPRTGFLPDEVRLAPVAVASLAGRAGEDGFLYLVATEDGAARLLARGLPLSRRAPLMLTERAGVLPWLAWRTETQSGDDATGPGVVLRLRRAMVADMLEMDPDHTAAFSAPCYWLSNV